MILHQQLIDFLFSFQLKTQDQLLQFITNSRKIKSFLDYYFWDAEYLIL